MSSPFLFYDFRIPTKTVTQCKQYHTYKIIIVFTKVNYHHREKRTTNNKNVSKVYSRGIQRKEIFQISFLQNFSKYESQISLIKKNT